VALLKYLAACNRSELPQDRRNQLMALTGPVVSKLRGALRWQYLKTPPPLDLARQSQADLAGALLMEMSEAYRLLIDANLAPCFRLFGGDPLPELLRTRLDWLHQCLVHHYEIHAAVPPGLWLDLHQAYTLAVRMGHADSGKEGGTASDLYRAALLLAIADPYRMPDHEVPWALALIARQGRLARLIPAATTSLRPGAFAVDHHRDTPPYPLARNHDPLLQSWSFTLNTTELVKFLTWLLNYLASPAATAAPDLDPSLHSPRYPAFLQRLRRQWSASQQRLQQRHPTATPLDYQIISGFAALDASLSQDSSLSQGPYAVGLEHCQASNVSAGGISLHKTGDLKIPLQVGDLVGLRAGADAAWQVGVVRWLRSPTQGEVAFGVQLLPPHAHRVTLQSSPADASSGALLLTAQTDPIQGGLLVAKAGDPVVDLVGRLWLGGQARTFTIDIQADLGPDLAAWRIRLDP
jgi:hypothetical protein